MKIWALLLSSCVFSFCFTQKRYKAYEQFYYRWNSLNINDSVPNKLVKYESVYGPFDPITNSRKHYSTHYKYHFDNGQIISIDRYNDTVFLFKEFFLSKDNSEDSLISCGELKINPYAFEIKEMMSSNIYGGDSLIIDTLYHLVPHGFWSLQLDPSKTENGNFVYGLKEGEWYIRNAEYMERYQPTYLQKQVYRKDNLISETNIDLSTNIGQLETNLIGEWFNIGLNFNEIDKYQQTNTLSLFFTRDCTNTYQSFHGIYDFLSFAERSILKTKTSYRCGVGIVPPTEPQTWKINKKGELILNDETWKIEYLSRNQLIISISGR